MSRAFYIDLIPKNRSAQFFGFYNMLGKFAAVLGPALTGIVAKLTGSSLLSILALIVLFIIGGLLFTLVDQARGKADAVALEEAKRADLGLRRIYSNSELALLTRLCRSKNGLRGGDTTSDGSNVRPKPTSATPGSGYPIGGVRAIP